MEKLPGKTFINYYYFLLMLWFCIPCRRYSETFVTSMKESENVTAKHITYIFDPRYTGSIWLDRPMCHVKTCIYYRYFVFFGCMLKKKNVNREKKTIKTNN